VRGTSFFRFVRDQYFKNITKNIIKKTSSLNNENNEEEFRKKCLDLADYVIHNKKAPSYRNQLNKYGGCPLILEEKDKKILELKYEEVDFCDKRKKYLDEIQRLKGKLPKFICDLMKDQTFKKLTDCPPVNKLQPRESESEKEEIGSQTKDKEKKGESSVSHDSPEQAEPTEGVATNEINQYTKHNQHEEKNKEESESPSKPDVQTQAHVSSLESPSNEVEAKSEGFLESQTPTLLSNSQPSPEVSCESVALPSVPPDTKAQKPSESTLSSPISKYSSSSFASTIPSVTSGDCNASYFSNFELTTIYDIHI
ncbi:PIR Superfamily Protein, partial [Plasmodium malariae]